MSLIVVITNDGTGDAGPDNTGVGNYDWRVMVNRTEIARGRVEGHDRSLPFEDLVAAVAAAAKLGE